MRSARVASIAMAASGRSRRIALRPLAVDHERPDVDAIRDDGRGAWRLAQDGELADVVAGHVVDG